ncbi:MAG: transporter-related protein [Bacteroidetes bacterium]|jgi:ABC-type lipoprotein export system ATPase subunit|nr:transporter-related protein [Bacteroidota bacterium]
MDESVVLADIYKNEIGQLKHLFPEIIQYLVECGINLRGKENLNLEQVLENLSENLMQDRGLDRSILRDTINYLLEEKENSLKQEEVSSITIVGGTDKTGNLENMEIILKAGSVTGIVGPTGSGKSRLLADVEWLANGDTPTKRVVLVNGFPVNATFRFSMEQKLVAQLSQNMNFVMDATAGEFVRMHAESRFAQNSEQLSEEVIAMANELAGEQFSYNTPLTSLSGGQSRALMIADTALLSRSPIVLIDEIENAGIDRKKALGLLVKKGKIILLATHDPILALLAEKRMIIRNGGIVRVIETSETEKAFLSELEVFDNRMQNLRERLRAGECIDEI